MNYLMWLFLLVFVMTSASKGAIYFLTPAESIQSTVNIAEPLDTVILLDGEYAETVVLYGKDLVLASMFLLDGDTNHIAATRLSPDNLRADTLSCLVYAYGEAPASKVTGLTIENGRGTRLEMTADFVGGGVHVRNSSLTMERCNVTACSTHYGGALAVNSIRFIDDSSIRLSDCLFYNCKASQFGGALTAVFCSLKVDNCDFIADTAYIADGAATLSGCMSIVSGCNFFQNHGAVGGFFAGEGTLQMTNCVFEANTSNQFPGFAHLHTYDVSGYISGCHFTRSNCRQPIIGFGGSISLSFAGNVVELNTTYHTSGSLVLGDRIQGDVAYNIIRNNDNIRGAAIYSFSDARMRVHHNVIANNTAPPGDPGAIGWSTNSHTTADSNIIMGHNSSAVAPLYLPNRAFDARNNYWGDPSGPYHPTQNPGGRGDTLLSDSVLFIPWLTEPPDTTMPNAIDDDPRIPLASTWQILELFPNPFNNEIRIVIAGFTRNDFVLRLFNLQGREITVLHRGPLTGGQLSFTPPPELASGVYFVVASDQSFTDTRKAILLK